MYLRNNYLSYDNRSRVTLTGNGIISPNILNGLLRSSSLVLDDIIMSNVIKDTSFLDTNEKYHKLLPDLHNARVGMHVQTARLPLAHFFTTKYNNYTTATGKDSPSYEVLKEVMAHYKLNALPKHKTHLQSTIEELVKNAIVHNYFEQEHEELFGILTDYILSLPHEDSLMQGYMGFFSDLLIPSGIVIRNSNIRSNFTINTLSDDKEELESILLYSIGVCVKERNIHGLYFITAIMYKLQGENLL